MPIGQATAFTDRSPYGEAIDPEVAAGLRMKGASAAEVFGELRERKNKS